MVKTAEETAEMNDKRMMRWTESGPEMEKDLRQSLENGKDTEWLGKRLEYREEIDSTNTEAKRLSADGACHGTVILANRQTAGKGRRGRVWESPVDSGIFMTLLLKPQIDVTKVSMLTLVAALAVSKAVREVTGCACQIKWPNDLVIEGKKICGILVETGTSGMQIQHAAVGIGINVGQQEFPRELRDKATSLCMQTKGELSRAEIAKKVCVWFEKYYARFEAQGDLSGLREEYEAQLANLGRSVMVLAAEGEYSGTALGITDTGELLVRTEDGKVREVLSGEVSVRGIYGYV